MKKKMERLGDELFRPLTVPEGRDVYGGSTASTLIDTSNPNPDFYTDGESHN